jgi:DNA-binding Lrp family transcriptional regulator
VGLNVVGLDLVRLDWTNRQLVAALQTGLPLTPRPFAHIAKSLGISEREAVTRLQKLNQDGFIRRYGIVVKHRALGYCANAMVVWDVPDEEVAEVGKQLAAVDSVTLCYRRPRRLPDWPYNLFCMIHGRERVWVRRRLAEIIRTCGLEKIPHQVLFSTRQFKQRGGHYVHAATQEQGRVANG